MKRNWHYASPEAALAEAKQDDIAPGDTVRSYDFPGISSSEYVEGTVVSRHLNDDVRIEVTHDWHQGLNMGTNARPFVNAPLGVSSIGKWPCVYLVRKGAA